MNNPNSQDPNEPELELQSIDDLENESSNSDNEIQESDASNNDYQDKGEIKLMTKGKLDNVDIHKLAGALAKIADKPNEVKALADDDSTPESVSSKIKSIFSANSDSKKITQALHDLADDMNINVENYT